MAALNYSQRLENVKNRRFDESEVKSSHLGDSYSEYRAQTIPTNVKYLVDSMKPIDLKYNEKTIQAASYVQDYLKNGHNLNIRTSFKTQGSVRTNTNIKVHSDFDLLSIIDDYHYTAPGIPILNPHNTSIPSDDIANLRKQAIAILKTKYDIVDCSNEKCVSIFNKSLRRKVDVVFGFWYYNQEYIDTKKEYYLGIKLPNDIKTCDYPFAHIINVNYKGDSTSDGSRMGIRLLKTLREDCDIPLKLLKSFHITTIVHSIADNELLFSDNIGYRRELYIGVALSDMLTKIIIDPNYRRSLQSPNGCETPLQNDELVPELRRLKEDLDTLLVDISKELKII